MFTAEPPPAPTVSVRHPRCGPPRYQLAGTAEGFWQADQADLVAGYIRRYFPSLPIRLAQDP